MLILREKVKDSIFKTQDLYIEALKDVLDCLVQKEDYEKAAEVRDLIMYEEITDPEIKEIYKKEILNKYLMF